VWRCAKLARFPFLKTLDQFDFGFQPSVDERLDRELATELTPISWTGHCYAA
jgi:hypothetical protein